MLQLHRNPFVEFIERWRVWAILRRHGKKYSKLAAEEVSPYLAHLADVEEHEEELLTPAGREVSIVRTTLTFCCSNVPCASGYPLALWFCLIPSQAHADGDLLTTFASCTRQLSDSCLISACVHLVCVRPRRAKRRRTATSS